MIESNAKETKGNLHNMTITITPNEYSRLWCGELTEKDFSTSSPNLARVGKISWGVNKYLDYKRKVMEEI